MAKKGVERVKEFYEKTAKDYDREYETPFWKLYNEITWENMKQFLPKRRDGLVLDAGGGTGYWAIRLAKRGYRVLLTDISKNMLKIAKKKIKFEKLQDKIETKLANIRDMSSLASNNFDMALAEGDPVSYCLNPEKAIRELTRVVKPHAPVVISVDNKYSMMPRLIAESSFDRLSRFIRTGIIESRDGEFELQAFTPEELEALFENCGLRIVRIIGKPVFAQLLPREKRDEVIAENFKRLLDLELRFCDIPSLIGIGGHLEVVGIKRG